MAVFAWPAYGTDKAFWPATVELRQVHLNRQLDSDLSGDVQTASSPGSRWGWILNFAPQTWAERARLWGFLTRLNGKQHRVQLFDPHLPRPAGTCALTGVTAQAAPQFGTAITLNGCGAGATLLPGDWFAVNGQLLQVVVGGTANSTGVLAVETRHLLRAAIPAAAAVTLDQPMSRYILTTADFGTQYGTGNRAPEVSIEFREVFS